MSLYLLDIFSYLTADLSTWTANKNKFKTAFDKSLLKLAMNFLLEISCINFCNLFFRKITGIPMVSDPVPFMANLFFYYYENKIFGNHFIVFKVFAEAAANFIKHFHCLKLNLYI